MNKVAPLLLLAASFYFGTAWSQALPRAYVTDAEIRQMIIQESIYQYRGNCPCPYNVARNGSSCGARSAYSRPGGASPICYPADISQEMVNQYRQRLKQ